MASKRLTSGLYVPCPLGGFHMDPTDSFLVCSDCGESVEVVNNKPYHKG